MTASDEQHDAGLEEPSEPDEGPSVPNGEEQIDELGRNATQQRMDERGEPPVV